MPRDSGQQIAFHPFRLDVANQQLWREDQTVALSLKAFAVLKFLIEHRGQLVTKEELLEAVWPDTFVTDAVLKVRIGELRKALGDEAKTPRFIETAQRRGYRFIAKTEIGRGDTSAPAVGQASSPPLVVGREAELASLRSHLDQALNGRRQIVFISGEPGIGKTTLVSSFLREAESNLTVARGQCLEQYGGSEAYLPWLDAFSRLAREREDCVALFRRHAPMWLAQMPWLLDDAQRASLQNEIAGATRARMLREMAQLIEALTAQTPLVLALEDLHWSDYSTLDLIGYVARRTEPARLLLIGTYRPVEIILSGHPLKAVKQELRAHQLCVELPLDFLGEAEIADYLKLRFPAQEFPAELARLIHRRTDGNSLFMVSFVDELAPQWPADKASPAQLKSSMELIEVAAPANVRQLIEKQIERLSEVDQEILEAASVVGVEFSSQLAAAALQIDIVQTDRCCARLVRNQQLLRATGQQRLPDGTLITIYEFIHALYQNALYERVTMARRTGLHARIGEFKESSHADRTNEIAAELALHFEEGHDWERAAKYLLLATRQANEMFAPREAIALANRGLQVVAKLPEPQRSERELSFQIVLGNTLIAIRGFAAPEVMHAYSRARDLCQQIGETPYLLPVLYGLHANHLVRGEHQTALAVGEEFLERAKHDNDPAIVVGHRMVANPLFATGKLTQAREHLEEIARRYDPAQHRPLISFYGHDPGVAGYASLAVVTWLQGYPDLSMEHHRKIIELTREISHPHSQGHGLSWALLHYQYRREIQGTRELSDAIITIASEHGLELWLAWGTILKGWVMAEHGQPQEGIEVMKSGWEAVLLTGSRVFLFYYPCLLAEGYLRAGLYDEGLQALLEATKPVDAAEEQFARSEVHRLKGELLWLAGSALAEVEQCFKQSIDIARQQEAKSLELRTTMSLSRFWEQDGRRSDALKSLAKVYDWFTEGFDSPDLQEAKRLMQELS